MMPDDGENAIKCILLFYLKKYFLLSLNMTMVSPVLTQWRKLTGSLLGAHRIVEPEEL